MDWVEFFKKNLTKSSQDEIEPTNKLYSHFLAASLRAKGMNLNLTASSPSWGIRIIKHTSSNSLMKKYASSESKP